MALLRHCSRSSEISASNIGSGSSISAVKTLSLAGGSDSAGSDAACLLTIPYPVRLYIPQRRLGLVVVS